jgi:hypothetical protein
VREFILFIDSFDLYSEKEMEAEMKYRSNARILAIIITLLAVTLACSLVTPNNTDQNQGNSAQENNQSNQGNNQAANDTQGQNNPVSNDGNNSGNNTSVEPTNPPPPTPTVAHTTYPGQPGSSVWLAEASSEAYAPEGRSVADAFYKMQLERPFTSQAMQYQNYLDIYRAELSVTAPFVYVTIFLEGSPPAAVNAHYGIEIDADQDGRGDWLIYGLTPPGSDWTVAGVRVYQDTNNDVGGPVPLEADGALTTLNGYDQVLFNQGYDTTDPDMAWIRRDPSNADRIQLAFKYSVIGSANTFLWGVWADEGPIEPAWFDYNDHYTTAQAGSPLSNSPDYPLNELASVDNTCRWSYGFTPVGDEPGICAVPATPTPVPPGNLRGLVFIDETFNGVHDSGESGFGGLTVTLGSGACSSSGLASTTTELNGHYEFNNLTPGTYCVTVQITLDSCGYHTLTGKSKTVTVGAGQTITVPDMGFDTFPC